MSAGVSNGATRTISGSISPSAVPPSRVNSTAFSVACTFAYFTVPASVTQLTVSLWGAGGGSANQPVLGGGAGGYVDGTLLVTPSETLRITVGSHGYAFITPSPSDACGLGGPVGQTPGCWNGNGGKASGGGMSAIARLTGGVWTYVAIAGGGGGTAKMDGGSCSGGFFPVSAGGVTGSCSNMTMATTSGGGGWCGGTSFGTGGSSYVTGLSSATALTSGPYTGMGNQQPPRTDAAGYVAPAGRGADWCSYGTSSSGCTNAGDGLVVISYSIPRR